MIYCDWSKLCWETVHRKKIVHSALIKTRWNVCLMNLLILERSNLNQRRRKPDGRRRAILKPGTIFKFLITLSNQVECKQTWHVKLNATLKLNINLKHTRIINYKPVRQITNNNKRSLPDTEEETSRSEPSNLDASKTGWSERSRTIRFA